MKQALCSSPSGLLSRSHCILLVQLFAGVRRGSQAQEWWVGTPPWVLSLSCGFPRDTGGQRRMSQWTQTKAMPSFLWPVVGRQFVSCLSPESSKLRPTLWTWLSEKEDHQVRKETSDLQRYVIVTCLRWPDLWHVTFLRWLPKFLLFVSAVKNTCWCLR